MSHEINLKFLNTWQGVYFKPWTNFETNSLHVVQNIYHVLPLYISRQPTVFKCLLNSALSVITNMNIIICKYVMLNMAIWTMKYHVLYDPMTEHTGNNIPWNNYVNIQTVIHWNLYIMKEFLCFSYVNSHTHGNNLCMMVTRLPHILHDILPSFKPIRL